MYFSQDFWDPLIVARYTSLVGVRPAIIMWYQDWASGQSSEFNRVAMNDVASAGATPMISWEADNANYAVVGRSQPAFSLSAIASGAHDDFISRWARAAAAWGRPFLLRPMWEMNGPWYPWGPGISGNTSALYIAAWRHIHDLFVQAGATNVRFVWCPGVTISGVTLPLAELYPGDAYVDWVGMDGYNWGIGHQGWSWQSLAQVFGPNYATLAALTNKPMIISEVGSSEVGGDKAAWITQAFQSDLPTLLPRVRAVVWFEKSSADGEPDWRIDSSAAALEAFRAMAATAPFRAQLLLDAPVNQIALPNGTQVVPPVGTSSATPTPTDVDHRAVCPRNRACPE